MESPIFVTKPYLPEFTEFTKYLERIWETKILTNQGPQHDLLEAELAKYLGVKHVSLFSNGALALMVALHTLKPKGEIITTPFSFVATANAIIWQHMTPVFCDVEPERCTIDPSQIEKLVTKNTTAILAVHVYGNPCYVEEIEAIAGKYNLKVIYDAAHTFGVTYRDKSILNYGDLSILSFHATKIFHTFEGGAIISHTREMKDQIDLIRNHGIADETTVATPGLNAKMNEIQAAMGLILLKDIGERIGRLKHVANTYREKLADIDGLHMLPDIDFTKHNYSYFPVFIDEKEFGMSRDQLYENLKQRNIFARRYFYPLISDFDCFRHYPSSVASHLPVAHRLASQVLCLPNHSELETSVINYVCDHIRELHHFVKRPYMAS